MVRTAKLWKIRPSELIDAEDPYIAYCFDTACEYIADKMLHKKVPKFPKDKEKREKGWTSNADLIAELQSQMKNSRGG